MLVLIAGLVLFLGAHTVPMLQNLKNNLVSILGRGGYMGLFTLISIIGLSMVVWGYGIARQDPVVLYYENPILRHIMLLLMVPVFILLIAAYLPGKIKQTLKHPMIIATKTWALAHLLVNGNLEDILLFGGFLVWAVLIFISLRKRDRANPNPGKIDYRPRNDIIAITAGIALYVVTVLWGHELIIGKALIPG